MAVAKEKKRQSLQSLEETFGESRRTLVFVNFHGLAAAALVELRKVFKQRGVVFTVVKKTLLRKALAETDFQGEAPALPGEIAVVYGAAEDEAGDFLTPARGIFEFVKKFRGYLKIVGGVFAGRYQDETAMNELAALPDWKALLGRLVSLLNWPLQRLAATLDLLAKRNG